MILSASMLLRHLGLTKQANSIAAAVYKVIADGKYKTRDLKGESLESFIELFTRLTTDNQCITGTTSTSDFTKAVIDQL